MVGISQPHAATWITPTERPTCARVLPAHPPPLSHHCQACFLRPPHQLRGPSPLHRPIHRGHVSQCKPTETRHVVRCPRPPRWVQFWYPFCAKPLLNIWRGPPITQVIHFTPWVHHLCPIGAQTPPEAAKATVIHTWEFRVLTLTVMLINITLLFLSLTSHTMTGPVRGGARDDCVAGRWGFSYHPPMTLFSIFFFSLLLSRWFISSSLVLWMLVLYVDVSFISF